MTIRRIVPFLALLALAHCASAPPPPPVLDLTIIAGAGQNPDPAGVAEPVAIRIYQLASGQTFATADAFALIGHDAATLGRDDLGSEQLIIAPGAHRAIAPAVTDGAHVLAVAVLFRDIDHATWRAQAPLAEHGPTRLILKTTPLGVTLEPQT